MRSLISRAGGRLAACAAVASISFAAPVFADTPPDFVVTFPAGWACVYDLQIEGWFGNTHRADLTFKEDKNGFIRSISAGIGSTLRYTNTSNLKSMMTQANGAVTHTMTYAPDGSQTVAANGHNVMIMFPSDFPPGPSTVLYTGRIVYTLAPPALGGYATVQSYSGKAVDICAALM